jgi:hypothetical protein
MATPEAKVKAKVKALLAKHKVYYFMPATHGYGSSGVPDIVACMQGKFIGIETKANGGVPTALQMKNLMSIVDNMGMSLIIDETGIGMFAMMLETWQSNGIPPQGYIAELYDRAVKVPRKKSNAKPKSPN